MIHVLDQMLCERFPTLYKDRTAGVNQSALAWGFSCGDGWFPLLFELSEKIEAELKRMRDASAFPEGTKVTKRERPAQDGFRVSQVKSKFGTLRFYVNGTTDEINAAIREAERKSAITCEDCGAPGVLRGKSWLHTSCEKCAKGDLPVGCSITNLPCSKGTVGCAVNHMKEDAEEVEEVASSARVAFGKLQDKLHPPSTKELDPKSDERQTESYQTNRTKGAHLP